LAKFVVNEGDKCVYCQFERRNGMTLFLYLDDILIFCNDVNIIEEVKYSLCGNFEINDLGEANVVLNIKILGEGVNRGLLLWILLG
jgi:hypothetical protein